MVNYSIKRFDIYEITISDFIKNGYARIVKPSELLPFSGERKYISTSCVNEDGIFAFEKLITYNDRPSRASMKPIVDSLWFAKMKDSVKVFKSLEDDENEYVLSTGFYGIVCDSNIVDNDWILEVFRSKYFNDQKNRFSEGSSMSAIKDSQLSDIKLPLFKNRQNEKDVSNLISKISLKISIEKDVLKALLKQKECLLNDMFI